LQWKSFANPEGLGKIGAESGTGIFIKPQKLCFKKPAPKLRSQLLL